ncbi:MAG: adenylyl-sulfate kinase [Gammaproteobacteria bacterium]|jgi:adenylylsulfate kinase
MNDKTNNLTWHDQSVTHAARAALKGHAGALLWFTGLSGAGKSTVANAVDHRLNAQHVHTYLLDGDNIRLGLNSNLGFSTADREENIRRIGEVGKLLVDAGLIVCAAFISPYRRDRDRIRKILPAGRFIEIHVHASLATCEARDPKDLYKKARAGEIKGFTGIDDPYEAPKNPEITLDSDAHDVATLAAQVVDYLGAAGLLSLD